jgi:mono/diheme cytochrome c family protein
MSQSPAGHGTIDRTMRRLAITIFLGVAAGAAACRKASPSQPSEARREAQAMYVGKCAVCHGIGGAGNGPSADAFTPKPHDYTDPAWQARTSDDEIKQIILEGGANLNKNPAMPSNILLRDRPDVLDELVKIIRGFGERR